ncbi:MAG: hypothetical protein HY887_05035 [Deltaproteobacteria bacterium]|nr:hypothetical protein [Deltaproteobacteria bacterium]
MAIISFDRDFVVDYMPAYGGNRESDNPCVVRLKFVPYAKVQEYGRLIALKAKGVGQEKLSEIGRDIQRRQFTENVESVSGYYVGAREVADASEFYDTAPADLIYEVIKAMEDSAKLSEGQRKN